MPPGDEPDDLPDDSVEEVRAVRRAHAEARGFDPLPPDGPKLWRGCGHST